MPDSNGIASINSAYLWLGSSGGISNFGALTLSESASLNTKDSQITAKPAVESLTSSIYLVCAFQLREGDAF